jgi:hypothetical protein
MISKSQDNKTSDRSPLSGCAILITAVLVLVFLMVFSVLTLFRQYEEIVKFTASVPRQLETSAIENRRAELDTLKGKIVLFHEGLLSGEGDVSLELTPDEINLAIDAFDVFRDLRGNFRVVRIDDDKLEIAICFRLNGKPRLGRKDEGLWVTSDPRYLIGTLVSRPALLKHEVVLQIDAIEVDGAQVPEGFIGQMSPYRLAERYISDPILGPAMSSLTSVRVEDGCLVFSKRTGEVPGDEIGRGQVDSSGRRLFAIFGTVAVVFLAVAGLVIFLGLRKKASGG